MKDSRQYAQIRNLCLLIVLDTVISWQLPFSLHHLSSIIESKYPIAIHIVFCSSRNKRTSLNSGLILFSLFVSSDDQLDLHSFFGDCLKIKTEQKKHQTLKWHHFDMMSESPDWIRLFLSFFNIFLFPTNTSSDEDDIWSKDLILKIQIEMNSSYELQHFQLE